MVKSDRVFVGEMAEEGRMSRFVNWEIPNGNRSMGSSLTDETTDVGVNRR